MQYISQSWLKIAATPVCWQNNVTQISITSFTNKTHGQRHSNYRELNSTDLNISIINLLRGQPLILPHSWVSLKLKLTSVYHSLDQASVYSTTNADINTY